MQPCQWCRRALQRALLRPFCSVDEPCSERQQRRLHCVRGSDVFDTWSVSDLRTSECGRQQQAELLAMLCRRRRATSFVGALSSLFPLVVPDHVLLCYVVPDHVLLCFQTR